MNGSNQQRNIKTTGWWNGEGEDETRQSCREENYLPSLYKMTRNGKYDENTVEYWSQKGWWLQRKMRGLEKTSRGSWSPAGGGVVKVEVAGLREGPGCVPEVGEVPPSQARLVRKGEGEESVELWLEGGGGATDQGGGQGPGAYTAIVRTNSTVCTVYNVQCTV